MQMRIIWEESLHEAFCRSGWVRGMPLGYCYNSSMDVESSNLLRVASFPGFEEKGENKMRTEDDQMWSQMWVWAPASSFSLLESHVKQAMNPDSSAVFSLGFFVTDQDRKLRHISFSYCLKAVCNLSEASPPLRLISLHLVFTFISPFTMTWRLFLAAICSNLNTPLLS